MKNINLDIEKRMQNYINKLRDKRNGLQDDVKALEKFKLGFLSDEQLKLVDDEIFITNQLIEKLSERIEFEGEYMHSLKGCGYDPQTN